MLLPLRMAVILPVKVRRHVELIDHRNDVSQIVSNQLETGSHDFVRLQKETGW